MKNGEPNEIEVGPGEEVDYYDIYRLVNLISDYYEDNFAAAREKLIISPRKRALLGITEVNDYNVAQQTFSKLTSLLSLMYEDVRDIGDTFGDTDEEE